MSNPCFNLSGIVGLENVRNVTTKYGEKPVYSYDIGGTIVEVGFKRNPAITPGKTVDVVVEKAYGTFKFVMVGRDTSAMDLIPGPSAPIVAAKSTGSPAYSGKPFPLPRNHGDISIIRQSALKCATDLVIAASDNTDTLDSLVEHAIGVAYKLAAFSSGQLDVERAEEVATAVTKGTP
jgi:hypothetical protein